MKMNRRWMVVLGLSTVMFPLSPLWAETKGNGPCREDVEKFCKDVQPGGGRIMKCLKDHESELSEGCKQQWAAKKAQRKENRDKLKDACKDDARKFCADVKPGGGRIIRCLKEHESDLSAGCRDALPKKK